MSRPRLMIVDDDPYTRQALGLLFGRRGWDVRLAGSVAEGLALVETAPRCAILDLILPDGGGEAVLRALRTQLPGTRVAVCSGATDPQRLAAVRGLRPEVMLWKPIEMTPLYQLCDAAFASDA